MTCPECEYNKARASLWRHEAYKLGGTPLPWDVDAVIARVVAAEREACARVVEAEQARVLAAQEGVTWDPVNVNIRMTTVLLPEVAAAIRSRT